MGSARAVGIAALVIALTGCATVSAPEPGFSDEEWADVVRVQGDLTWEYFGFPAELRPPDPPMEFVSREEFSAKFAGCMNDAGFDNYLADGSVVTSEDGTQTDAELMANYDCSMRIVVRSEDSGMLNAAERDYWYDYFEQWLVPCLRDHGIELFDAQSREKFHESYGWWNPYVSVRETDRERINTDEQLYADCSPVPPGAEDPGYFGFGGSATF